MAWPTRKAVEGLQKFQDPLQNSDHTDLTSGARAEVGRSWPDSQDQESTKGARRDRQGWVTGQPDHNYPGDSRRRVAFRQRICHASPRHQGKVPGPVHRVSERLNHARKAVRSRHRGAFAASCRLNPSHELRTVPLSSGGTEPSRPIFLTCLVSERSLVAPVNILRPCGWVLPTADPPDSGEPSCPSTRCR